MIIKKMKYIKKINMFASSIDAFEVIDENGNTCRKMSEIWYSPLDLIPQCFFEAFGKVENSTEAFSMWADELIKHKVTNYSEEELMGSWNHYQNRKF